MSPIHGVGNLALCVRFALLSTLKAPGITGGLWIQTKGKRGRLCNSPFYAVTVLLIIIRFFGLYLQKHRPNPSPKKILMAFHRHYSCSKLPSSFAWILPWLCE